MSGKYKGQVCTKNSEKKEVVGLPGIEPGTSRLSGVRSNRLSYKPTRNVLEREDVRENTAALSFSKSTINYTPQKGICQINFRTYALLLKVPLIRGI